MQGKFSRTLRMLLFAGLLIVGFCVPAQADMGPKESVRIYFKNMEDELCYGTLLSKDTSTGPYSAWDGEEHHGWVSGSDLDYATWKAFVDYADSDSYYFLQECWQVNESKEIIWTYYPPSSFKILLYWPQSGTFAVSGILSQYAFDTYYTVDMTGVGPGFLEYGEPSNAVQALKADRSYEYGPEIRSLLVRIVLTILVEIIVALLFGFWEKKQQLVLMGVNAATQVILNVLLNIIDYRSGPLAFTICYILLEGGIIAVEAVLYCILLKKASLRKKKNWYYVLYSFVANIISCCAGMALARVIPGIF